MEERTTSFGQTKVNRQGGGSPYRTSIKHFKDHQASITSTPTAPWLIIRPPKHKPLFVLYADNKIRKHIHGTLRHYRTKRSIG